MTYPADAAHGLRSPVQQCRHDVGVLGQDGSEQLAALSAAEFARVLAYVGDLFTRKKMWIIVSLPLGLFIRL